MSNVRQSARIPPALIALAAAGLFGASTPAAKLLIGQIHPQLLAGLLYLGSGTGLILLQIGSRFLWNEKPEVSLKRTDLPWLVGAVLSGGVAAPILLMTGLTITAAGTASLLLNMEAVFTALLAWFAFKENFDKRIFWGMVSIVVGSLILTWQPGMQQSLSLGSILIIAACFCWGLDNNFTRNISHADPVQIACIKGTVAGVFNCAIALASGQNLPSIAAISGAALLGFFGYGLSLVLFIKALRYLGSARTGAYFSTAPFAGAILSILFLREPLSGNLLLAGIFMSLGVWLHLTEKHSHPHTHAAQEHEHLHSHDEHHQHDHGPDDPAGEPHSHQHVHPELTHEHDHYPDSEHRHEH
jgi:drug/metabolite transporter (DMT)-like permease